MSLSSTVIVGIIAGVLAIFVTAIWRATPERATVSQVVEASVEAGFTRDQAVFLSRRQLSRVGRCKSVGLSELTCDFLAYGVEHRHSDKDYYTDCGLSELTRKQCVLLREGVAGYRRAFAGN